jgi:hypothetical protein
MKGNRIPSAIVAPSGPGGELSARHDLATKGEKLLAESVE